MNYVGFLLFLIWSLNAKYHICRLIHWFYSNKYIKHNDRENKKSPYTYELTDNMIEIDLEYHFKLMSTQFKST